MKTYFPAADGQTRTPRSTTESPTDGTSPTDTETPSNELDAATSVSRRTMMKASALSVGAFGLVAPAAASGHDSGSGTLAVDSPEGFSAQILAGHANFPDDVAAKFRISYDDGHQGAIVSNLPQDASTVIFAKVTWAPEGTSGWHTHPGPVIVSVADGQLDLINERDCVVRTYSAGEAFIDPGQGNIHIASNPSTTDQAVAYATFLGVPDGKPATLWVPPVDC